MVFNYDKMNVKKLAVVSISFILAIVVAYYLQNNNENKLENFGDYFNYFLDKITFLYTSIILTFIFYTVFEFLLNNKEFKSGGKSFVNRSIRGGQLASNKIYDYSGRAYNQLQKRLGPDFVNQSIRGGQLASNKIYDYTGRAYNYLRPNRLQINPEFTVQPLYAPSPNQLQRQIMPYRMSGVNKWAALRGRQFYNPVD